MLCYSWNRQVRVSAVLRCWSVQDEASKGHVGSLSFTTHQRTSGKLQQGLRSVSFSQCQGIMFQTFHGAWENHETCSRLFVEPMQAISCVQQYIFLLDRTCATLWRTEVQKPHKLRFEQAVTVKDSTHSKSFELNLNLCQQCLEPHEQGQGARNSPLSKKYISAQQIMEPLPGPNQT